MAPDDASVTYPIRDVLSRIESKVDECLQRLDAKADRKTFDDLNQRFIDLTMNGSRTAKEAASQVHEVEARLRVVESTQASKEAVSQALSTVAQASSRARTAIMAAATSGAVGLIAAVVSGLIAHHH